MIHKKNQIILGVLLANQSGKIKPEAAVTKTGVFSLVLDAANPTPPFALGRQFKVNVILNSGGYSIRTAQAKINFDQTILQVVGGKLTAGSILPNEISNVANNTTGSIDYTHSVTPGSTNYFNGTAGLFASITFTSGVNGGGNGTVNINFIENGAIAVDATSGESIIGSVNNLSVVIGYFPPSVPGDVSISYAFPKIHLSWTASTPGTAGVVSGYQVLRSESPTGTPTVIATVPSSQISYDDNSVQVEKRYYYYVKSFDNQTPPTYSDSSAAVNTLTESAQANIRIYLQSPSDFSTTGTIFEVFAAGAKTDTATPVLIKTDLATDQAGNASVVLTGINPGNYDFYIKTKMSLSKKIGNLSLNQSPISLIFGTSTDWILVGDIDLTHNDFIGSDDLARIIADWPSRNNNAYRPNSDIDKSGEVDGVDADKIIGNWDKKGDLFLNSSSP
jgi:hypothetical protein